MAVTGTRGERDSWLAPALLVAGIVALGYAALHHWNAQDMMPGVEGAATVGVFAPILLLLHGISFSEMLKAAIPIWIIQFAATAAASGPAIAALGIDLSVLGAIGVGLRALAAHAPAASIPAHARATSSAPSFGMARAVPRH